MKQDLVSQATNHITNILSLSVQYTAEAKALVVYDTKYGLTDILTEAYRAALPNAEFINFDTSSKEEVMAAFGRMSPRDLVVLIQSDNFRLDAFRIRLHLFEKKLKVIEHVHLARNTEDVWDVYINALEYPSIYRTTGPRLKEKLEHAGTIRIEAGDAVLTVSGGIESPKLNIGDYTGMENVGGTFPIGEVFTESKDFSRMNGSFMIYAYAGGDFCVEMHEPFRVDVEAGIVVGWGENTPQSFIDIVNMIRQYERPLIREIGFGMNKAITRERYLQDITAFERIYGMHLSLGEKHSVFKKEGITTTKTKFHVDLFPHIDRVYADGNPIFQDGKYVV